MLIYREKSLKIHYVVIVTLMKQIIEEYRRNFYEILLYQTT